MPAEFDLPKPAELNVAGSALDLQGLVNRLAQEAGFAIAGIVPVEALGAPSPGGERGPAEDYFDAWIEQGHAGEMEYLKRRDEQGRLVRSSLAVAVPWARSVIVCAALYNVDAPHSTDPAGADEGWIARYAWSGTREADGSQKPADYHKLLLRRLKGMEAALHQEIDDFQSWAYVDTGPLVERAYARLAGVGWTGKNACTLNQELGSFLYLGTILTSLEVAPEQRATIAADRCGSCTRCIDACPTDALIAPYQMDASRCIAYLTIEKRGSIDPALRAGMGRQLFGCDICQDVCPWNRKAPVIVFAADGEAAQFVSEMEMRPELVNPSLAWLGEMSEEEFGRVFFGSPVKRARYAGLRRNVAIAMGNSGSPGFLPRLEAWAADSDEVLAETAAWAIARLGEPGR